MGEQEVARQFKEKTESTTWTRRSLLSWLGNGCVLALAGRGVSGGLAPNRPSERGRWARCGQEGFEFQPGDRDLENWYERTVDPQVLDDILAGWKLSVGGLVENDFSLTFDQLVSLPSHNPVVDFHCVEGWSVYDVPWNGVPLNELFTQARVAPSASYVNFHTVGGEYNESIPLSVALETNTILAYGVGGSSLSLKHGFPARIVIPRLFGYKNAKFVERIELSDHPIMGYWVRLGYSYEGEVQPSRLRDGKY
jgi:DMSO/TMAO reductase YedYZ molybdopterin-dependent catalytic subunit